MLKDSVLHQEEEELSEVLHQYVGTLFQKDGENSALCHGPHVLFI